MQVKLSMIKSSPQPVRTLRDEQKMKKLMQSIKKHGLLQAVKLRPAGDKYEIVFGNRRVEAYRRLGLGVIEAVVKDVGDTTALTQALVENLQREGLSNYDEGLAYKRLRDECELTQKEIAQLVGKSRPWITRCIGLVEDETIGGNLNYLPGAAEKAQIIRGALGNDLEAREVFAAKVANEGLTVTQTQDVAAALKRTQDPEVRRRILELPTADATIWESVAKHEASEKRNVERSRWDYLDESPCAKNFIRHIKINTQTLKRLWQDVERGALGIEHMPYVEERLRKYAKYIISLADTLAKWREEAINGS